MFFFYQMCEGGKVVLMRQGVYCRRFAVCVHFGWWWAAYAGAADCALSVCCRRGGRLSW
jgi:hypothetical protein